MSSDPLKLRRKLVKGDEARGIHDSWFYIDKRVRSAAIIFAIHGFNLADFDNFLEQPGWDSEKAKANQAHLLEKRQAALDAYRDGRKSEWLGWINFLQAAMQTSRAFTKVGERDDDRRRAEKVKQDETSRINSENASGPRESEHRDQIRREFLRLVGERHTAGEARGIIFSWGTLGSRSTIRRHTKDLE